MTRRAALKQPFARDATHRRSRFIESGGQTHPGRLLATTCSKKTLVTIAAPRSLPVSFLRGALAQLVERLNGIEKVSGSNPLCSTTSEERLASLQRPATGVMVLKHASNNGASAA